MRWLVPASALLCAAPAFAASGTVVDTAGKPLAGAKICYLLGGAEGLCVETDTRGVFELPTSAIDRVRISKDGYLPREVAAVAQSAPLALERSAEIVVRLIDRDGKPIREGEVFLLFPSGARKGPFPVNERGVRVRSLAAGEYRVVAQVKGLVQERSASARLVEGRETAVEVRLVPAPAPPTGTPGGGS